METVAPFAEAIEEIRKAGADSVRLCFQCGKCDVYCPWNTVRDFSIRKIIREAPLNTHGLRQGRIGFAHVALQGQAGIGLFEEVP